MSDLVIASLEAWDDIWRRNQYFVTELLRADPVLRVLFVEPAADPLYAWRRGRMARWGRGLRPGPELDGVAAGRLWLYQPTKLLPRAVDPRADQRLARVVVRATRQVGFAGHGRRPVLWINDPSSARLVTATDWPALYDVTDDWLAAERSPGEHCRLQVDEELLLARCAEVVVCSTQLAASKGHSRAVTVIANGVDVERYRRAVPRPGDLPAGRTALYLGTVHPDRFDVDVLRATAGRLRGAATVVLVGPVVDLSSSALRGLTDAGVVLLGPRPFEAVPGYLQHADVLLVPHIVNEFTESLDPIKAYEYRAVGRPVVATPVAGFRQMPGVAVARSEEFPECVARELAAASTPGTDLTGPVPDVPTWRHQAALMAEVIARTARGGATPR